MASQKHLKDLLLEDQEPFHLSSYISDRQSQIKRPRTDLQIKTRQPITQNARFPSNFCRNACFFSFHQSPDPRKSPLFDFQSPNQSPNSLFHNIPSRTAALLLEAAVRIQKQSSDNMKTKTQNRGNAFGLFGSMMKKLTHRKKREISGDDLKVSVKDILKWDSPVVNNRFSGNVKGEKISTLGKLKAEKNAFETRLSCSCNGRPSSDGWSESNEDKSLDCDLESSSSSESSGLEEMDEFASEIMDGVDFSDYDKHFCESPFHFVLHKSPSPGCRTPNFSSPAASPSRLRTEKKENYEVESLKNLQMEEEDEDKEQCSPVSVLDAPFEYDDDGNMDEDDEEQSFNYGIVQRAKHQLLQKLCRCYQLGGLDPVDLEKRMSEEEHDNSTYDHEEQECQVIEESYSHDKEETETNILVQEILESTFNQFRRIPDGMKRLVLDLIAEEETYESIFVGREMVAKRVCKRMDSWREVASNTIDMMVEHDFRQKLDSWKRNHEEVQVTALEIELDILGYLVEELSEELSSF